MYLCIPAEEVPLGIRYQRSGSKNWNDAATGPRRKFDDIFSRLGTIHQRDKQTDGRTDGRTDYRHRATAKIGIALTHSVTRQKIIST